MSTRRAILGAVPALAFAPRVLAVPAAHIVLPRDHGAHPALRTEWWYMTGRLTAGAREFGFQVTFFRSRVDETQGMRSRFAAKQLLFAHAAISDVQGGKLWHDQRIAREGFEVAQAAQDEMRLKLRDWSLVRSRQGDYLARISAGDFQFELRCAPTQEVLLQGDQGLSTKGPLPSQTSYYYSHPQLAVSGSIVLRGQRLDVSGRAWLDHEWSDEVLARDAVGWDWIGMNFDDGGALTAFRVRRADGSPLWDGGSFRAPGRATRIFPHGQVVFSPSRHWSSPLSQASYPVAWTVRTPSGTYTVTAVLDNQELDSRASTGSIYWEGLAQLMASDGKPVGWGYLEMTGYAQRLRV